MTIQYYERSHINQDYSGNQDKVYCAIVKNFKSFRSGKAVANQFEITIENGDKIFQSYESIIAIRTFCGKVLVDCDRWDYSNTTSRYRKIFLGESTKETKEKIDNGTYLLTDLNGCMRKYR
jgi:hypothetical protein